MVMRNHCGESVVTGSCSLLQLDLQALVVVVSCFLWSKQKVESMQTSEQRLDSLFCSSTSVVLTPSLHWFLQLQSSTSYSSYSLVPIPTTTAEFFQILSSSTTEFNQLHMTSKYRVPQLLSSSNTLVLQNTEFFLKRLSSSSNFWGLPFTGFFQLLSSSTI